MVMNIVYSTVVACLVEVFLIANVSMISSYLRETRYRDSFFLRLTETETLMAFVYLLSGIAIFSVTFFALQERSMRYISRISSAIQNISEGDLNTTIEVRGDDEFTAMAVNLNKMVGDIRNLMDKEREAERTKNELITNVAHDLRTPLTSIIGYLELLSGKVEIPAEMQKKYIDIAYAKSKRLEKLIEDLFGFTKMNYGKVAMHVSKVDIVKLLSQLLEEFYPSFKDKNLSYELQSNVPGKVITADGNLLARLFDNLINNAINYTSKEDKQVFVTQRNLPQCVRIEVRDTGDGIEEDKIKLIFDKYYRSENHKREVVGTGLGLSIVKEILKMHNYNYGVNSKLGEGSTFWFEIRDIVPPEKPEDEEIPDAEIRQL